MMAENSKRQLLLSRWGQLHTERSSWMAHWKEISDHLLPRSGRFFTHDRNRGEKRHNNIYDNTGTTALRVLAAGMMAGMTSPARPWFRLTTSDPQLDESAAVKAWLADVTRLMQMVFARSNTYRALPSMYEELGAFGTASSIVLADFDTVIHHYTLTAGEYALAANSRGQIDTLYRQFQMTVAQMVREFGRDRCSPTVQGLFDRGALEQWVTVMQAIEPRDDRDLSKRDSQNMAWQSIYFEPGGNEDRFLRESGFKQFPALCPRWAVVGGDVYGHSPAMEALGDVRQLQHEQLRKAQGIDYKTKPPLQAPTSLKSHDVDILPGGISFVDAAAPNGGIRPAFDVSIDLSHLLADIKDVRERIRGGFYADLFLMLSNGTTPRMTAAEVAERHEEKLLMLGPVLERMHNEILDPLIDMTFSRMVEANIVPPPPEELQGMELNVEFVSMLAQAQRAIATNSMDRFVGNLGAVAGIKPEVLDKFDADRWADTYADLLGVDPELIVPGDKVALVRQQRAQAQQAAQQAALINQGADTAQKLGAVDTSQQNALTDVTRAFSGTPEPSPQTASSLATEGVSAMSKWNLVTVPALADPATGAVVGFVGADGKEYLIATSPAFAPAPPTLYNPANVAITGGSISLGGGSISVTSGSITLVGGKLQIGAAGGVASTLTDSSGTPGNVTQNVTHGRVAFAAGASTITVTNSLVAATSTVLVVLQGADATLTQILRCTSAAGSFTVVGNAAATAAVAFGYVVMQS